jgi:hypothetical protein
MKGGKYMFKFFTGIMGLFYALLWLLGGLIHLWTVYIAYSVSGWFWGIISLFFPIISQIVWGFIAWNDSGLESAYIQWLVVLVVMWIIYYIIYGIISFVENKSIKQREIKEEISSEHNHLNGIGGWLALVLIGLVIGLFVIGFTLMDTMELFHPEIWHSFTTYGSDVYHPLFGTWIILETGINIFTGIFTVFLIVLMLKKHRFFPKLMIINFAIAIPLQLIDYYISYTVLTDLPVLEEKPSIDAIIRASIQALIWIPYFMKSKRVKVTFRKKANIVYDESINHQI